MNSSIKTLTLPYPAKERTFAPVLGIPIDSMKPTTYGSAEIKKSSTTCTFTLASSTTYVILNFSYIIEN